LAFLLRARNPEADLQNVAVGQIKSLQVFIASDTVATMTGPTVFGLMIHEVLHKLGFSDNQIGVALTGNPGYNSNDSGSEFAAGIGSRCSK
jgi:hypothetical protein